MNIIVENSGGNVSFNWTKEKLSLVLSQTRYIEVLFCIPERERRVLVLRFGVLGKKPHSINRVAEKLGVTVGRARGIQTRAMRRIRKLLDKEVVYYGK